MPEQINTPLYFEGWFTKNKRGATGLTVTVDVYRGVTKVVSDAAAFAVGGGIYGYLSSAGTNNAADKYNAVFKTADATVDYCETPSFVITGGWVENVNAPIGSVPAAIWNYLASASTTVGSLGKLLVDNLNAAISTRLASSSYTAPPTASQNASQVRAELEAELERIDVAVSTRSTQTSVDELGTAIENLESFTADDRTVIQATQTSSAATLAKVSGWENGPSTIYHVNPVAEDGKTLEINQGDAYLAKHNSALTWPPMTDPRYPAIKAAGLTWWLVINNVSLFAREMVATWDGDELTLTIELTSDQTAVLNKQCRRFLIQALEEGATPTDNEQVSLVVGAVEVRETLGALTGTPVPP